MNPTQPVRICRVTPSFPSEVEAGVGLPSYHLTVNISVPTLVVTRKEKSPLKDVPSHARVKAFRYPEATLSANHGWRVPRVWMIKLFGYALFFAQSLPAMIRFRPDIVHLHSAIPILHGLFARYFLGARLIVQLKGGELAWIRRSRLLQRALSKCDCIMYVSRSMESTLRSFLPAEKLMYIANGVDLDLFDNQGCVRRNQVCMIGELRWKKGYDYALDAFSGFSESHPGYRLIIAGDGPLRLQLQEQVLRLGMEEKVMFVGLIERRDVADLLSRSKLLMISSRSEGFPKVALEAAACGTPIVATDVGSCGEVAMQAGIVVPPENSDALAAAMRTLVDDNRKWSECSQGGMKFAKDYDWGAVAGRVYQRYLELNSV